MKKPIIGVTPLFDDRRESIWMVAGYLKSIQYAGGIPVVLSLSDCEKEINQIAQDFDGFLFTGGHDVDPSVYGEEKLPFCANTCKYRDDFEKILFEKALKYKKPILAICRGFQFMNAMLGGSLYQDIESQTKPNVKLTHSQEKPYNAAAHSVKIYRDTPLYDLIKADDIEVNSIHHQAVKVLSDKLVPMAIAPDGIIEAAYMPDEKFVLGVQWHPEFMYENDEAAARLFEGFVIACYS
ncbi:MAG: gamma-glutamyl-gamma-aminobutyrate hydrolase family protein [Eubacteriaceae bacterium]|nr:gamma-glutamyl-gamma-aminobutyrate hydrolase family protein [Eubacteriaceae bacterium]